MERSNALVIGAPRQGKSYWLEKQAIAYAKKGGTSVVYNVGKPSDFSGFISVSIVTVSEYMEAKEASTGKRALKFNAPKRIGFFRIGESEKVYKIEDFCKLFRGKCVKIERIFDDSYRSEDFFFDAVYMYFYNTFFIMDDCRTIFRNGFQKEICGLLSRINHAGKQSTNNSEKLGVDVALVYHGFNTVNPEAYQFINRICQFKTAFSPTLPANASELSQELETNYNKLDSLPKYSYCIYDIYGGESKFFQP